MQHTPTRKAVLASLLALIAFLPTSARALDLWPLAEFSPERTMVLYPFYVHEGDFVMAFPFYYRTNQGHDNHFVWPIAKVSDGRLTRLAPVWYAGDSGTFTVFPLLRQTPTYTAWAVPPIYTRHDGKFLGVFPFYAKSPNMMFVAPSYYKRIVTGESHWALLPIYFHDKTATTQSDMIPGLFRNKRDHSDRELWVIPYSYERHGQDRSYELVPIYFQKNSPDESSYSVPFVYHYNKTKDSSKFWLVPFTKAKSVNHDEMGLIPFWYYECDGPAGKQSTDLWLLPFFRSTTPKGYENLLLPLFYNSYSKDNRGVSKDFCLLPWVSGSTPTSSYSGLLPLYYTSMAKNGDTTNETFNLLWPVFHRERTTVAGKETEYSRRFLVFSDSKESNGARSFGVLGITHEWMPSGSVKKK